MSGCALFSARISEIDVRGTVTALESPKKLEDWIDVDVLKSIEFLQLIRGGVPNYLRTLIWQVTSGSSLLKWSHNSVESDVNKNSKRKKRKDYSHFLARHRDEESIATAEIERDLHRTLPSHPLFQGAEGLESLRRVLVAYSWKNPDVGYCQSLNVIAALLLCYLSEEETFWMIGQICEDILPDRYTPSMIGTMVDQQAFGTLLETHLSDIARHLTDLDIPVPLITLPWFMCLFIGFLPWEANLRALDWFFCQGVVAFFQISLALFSLHREKILSEEDPLAVIAMLKSNIQVSATALFEETLRTYVPIVTPQVIADLREFHYPLIYRHLQQQSDEPADEKCQVCIFFVCTRIGLSLLFSPSLFSPSLSIHNSLIPNSHFSTR